MKNKSRWLFANQFVHDIPLTWKRRIRTLFQMSSWSIFKWIWTLFQLYTYDVTIVIMWLLFINIAEHVKRKDIVAFLRGENPFCMVWLILNFKIHIFIIWIKQIVTSLYSGLSDYAKRCWTKENNVVVMMHGLYSWR